MSPTPTTLRAVGHPSGFVLAFQVLAVASGGEIPPHTALFCLTLQATARPSPAQHVCDSLFLSLQRGHPGVGLRSLRLPTPHCFDAVVLHAGL